MTKNKTNSNWINSLADTKLRSDKFAYLSLQAVGNTRQDMSRPILEDLLGQGYQLVTWDSGTSTHSLCVELNNQQWTLEDFVSNLNHDAPLFEKSHPGDISCSVVVSGEGLQPVRVDSFGNIEEI